VVVTAAARVLVVEDDEDLREMERLLLSFEGLDVATAGDGLQALDELRARPPPSVIVLDLRMPRMNGLELIQAMKCDRALATIPIIAVTGDMGQGRQALAAGAAASISKPFESRDLVSAVLRATRRRAAA
jgi:CheY-like chemotaxis protein